MANVFSFPLLHLPNNALQHVLRDMHILEKSCLSLLSKKTMNLVKSLELKIDRIDVAVGQTIGIHFVSGGKYKAALVIHYFEDPANYSGEKIQNRKPARIRAIYLDEHKPDKNWIFEKYEFEYLIDHFLTIFKLSKITKFMFIRASIPFDFVSVRKTIGDFTRLDISETAPNKRTDEVLKVFLPTKNILFVGEPFEDAKDIQKILIQNFNSIWLLNAPSLSLDELFLMNSSIIHIATPNLTEKDLNRFIRNWIIGSNPRLEYMLIEYLNGKVLNENIILKGLDYETVQPEKVRQFTRSVPTWTGKKYIQINGGFDIQRNNGTRATIRLKGYYGFQFFVQP